MRDGLLALPLRSGGEPQAGARNGSGGLDRLAQVLEPEQHGKGSLQLAVEVNLVARQTCQAIRLKCLAQSLGAQQGAVLQLLASLLVPGPNLLLEKAGQARRIWAKGLLMLFGHLEDVLPPLAG